MLKQITIMDAQDCQGTLPHKEGKAAAEVKRTSKKSPLAG
jgi:hypothetical protein